MTETDYADWIGHTRTTTDTLSPRLLAQFHATLHGTLAEMEVPPGAQWALWPDVEPPDRLGRDGHPRPGIVVPKLPLPRRMWAGGAVDTHAPLPAGAEVTHAATVRDIAFKDGRTGPLGFVTVDHTYSVGDTVCITERQDLVYREDPKPGAPAPAPKPGPNWAPRAAWQVTPSSTLLFRYSAITYNGHRIHYDLPYAQQVEGYDNLVVHGPMQAIWMQNLATTVLGQMPDRFTYRGLAPLTLGPAVSVEAQDGAEGLDLRVRRTSDGVVTMQGTATQG
ncbi:MAG: MaoC family dehydratase N-terminal domain-containing protein [Pseudomonadota bacterium]